MPRPYYRPELDALRFVAFFCVFVHHVPFTKGRLGSAHDIGSFGLQIFFVLSAYLIVTLLIRERETTGTVNIQRFAIRRVLRIWPLYFLVLFLGYFVGRVWHSAYLSGHAVVLFSFLAGNVYILQSGWTASVVTPLWSLSIEEQFYLGIPFLARYGGKRALWRIFFATLVVAYLVLGYLALNRPVPMLAMWPNSFVQFQFFAAGGLIALWNENHKVKLTPYLRLALCLLGFAFWILAKSKGHLTSMAAERPLAPMAGYLLLLVGTCVIFVSVLDLDAWVPKTLVYLGKISYGMYLFHQIYIWIVFENTLAWPKLLYFSKHRFLGAEVCLAATVVTAALSYKFFESPILKFKSRFETIHTRSV